MKNLLLILLLPVFSFGQINNFPWVHDFDNLVGLQQDQNDFGDWILKQGGTSSFATGPDGDHTTGFGTYYYVESSGAHRYHIWKPRKPLAFSLLPNTTC